MRVVNWDPKARTALSDEEVVYQEQQGKLYYLRYYVEGEDRYVVVATTRPLASGVKSAPSRPMPKASRRPAKPMPRAKFMKPCWPWLKRPPGSFAAGSVWCTSWMRQTPWK